VQQINQGGFTYVSKDGITAQYQPQIVRILQKIFVRS